MSDTTSPHQICRLQGWNQNSTQVIQTEESAERSFKISARRMEPVVFIFGGWNKPTQIVNNCGCFSRMQPPAFFSSRSSGQAHIHRHPAIVRTYFGFEFELKQSRIAVSIFPVPQLQQRSQQIMWILCPGHTNLSGSYSCLFPRRSRDVHILVVIFRDYLSITIILRSVVLERLVTLVLSIVSVPRSRILESEGHHHTHASTNPK